MANIKEIQNRIDSIQDTMKITKAMYMMSSMKLRKAKSKLEETEPFFYGVQKGIAETLAHFPDMQHIFFDNRTKDQHEEVKKKGYIVITGDKGMAGAYNHNAMKEAMLLMGDLDPENSTVFCVGEVGRAFFVNNGYPVDEHFRYSANNASMHRARVITEYLIGLYLEEKLDEIYVIYTKMINSATEETCVEQLLPLKTHTYLKEKASEDEEATSTTPEGGLMDVSEVGKINSYEKEAMENGDDWYQFYPSPKKVLERLVYNYVTGFMYGALIECSACEENSRMLAMQTATDNAEAMLHDLSIEYNRVRQAAITQEITEVIGGAKALKKKKKQVR